MSTEELIDSICLTWRHDFGIDKRHGPLGYQGMTDDERNALRSQMRQLLDHHGEQIAALYASQPTPEDEAVRRDAERWRTHLLLAHAKHGARVVRELVDVVDEAIAQRGEADQ